MVSAPKIRREPRAESRDIGDPQIKKMRTQDLQLEAMIHQIRLPRVKLRLRIIHSLRMNVKIKRKIFYKRSSKISNGWDDE